MGMEVVLFEVATKFLHCIQTKVTNSPWLDTFLLPKEQVHKPGNSLTKHCSQLSEDWLPLAYFKKRLTHVKLRIP